MTYQQEERGAGTPTGKIRIKTKSKDGVKIMAKHWISGVIKHHGVFRAAAKKAGMSTSSYAEKHKHASGVLGHRARLALTLMGLHKG